MSRRKPTASIGESAQAPAPRSIERRSSQRDGRSMGYSCLDAVFAHRKELASMDPSTIDLVLKYGWVVVLILALVLHRVVLRVFFGTVIVSEDEIGIVNKKWVLFGKNRTLPDGAIVALSGEAGLQADTLAPGIHFGHWAWQYAVSKVPFTTIDKGHIGIVEARDGHPLSGGRVLAKTIECNSFQDARAFLTKGGQRGPQISIIPPGTYRINTALFQCQPGGCARNSRQHGRRGHHQGRQAAGHGRNRRQGDCRPQHVPGCRGLHHQRRQQRPAGAGHSRRPLLHQSPLCHGRNQSDDPGSHRQRWRSHRICRR